MTQSTVDSCESMYMRVYARNSQLFMKNKRHGNSQGLFSSLSVFLFLLHHVIFLFFILVFFSVSFSLLSFPIPEVKRNRAKKSYRHHLTLLSTRTLLSKRLALYFLKIISSSCYILCASFPNFFSFFFFSSLLCSESIYDINICFVNCQCVAYEHVSDAC